jgi:phage protein D
MSKYGVRPGKLRLGGTGLPGGTQVELDGVDIAGAVTGVSLRIALTDRPTAVLDVVLHELDTELERPRVTVPDKTRDLLVRLGWTPPAEEATP